MEEFFGWVKTVAGMRRARHGGRQKIRQRFELAAAAYNLVRMKNLLAAEPPDEQDRTSLYTPVQPIATPRGHRALLQRPAKFISP